MKKFLAIILAVILCTSTAFYIYADDISSAASGDDGADVFTLLEEEIPDDTSEEEYSGEEYSEEDTSEEDTSEEDTSDDSSETDDSSDSSETTDEDETGEETTTDSRNSSVQVEPPEGDGDEYLTASFEEADSVVIVYGQIVQAPESDNPIIPGDLPGNSEECNFENGVCTDCGAINNGFAYVNGKWGYFFDQALQTSVTGFIYGTVKGISGWYYVENGGLNTDYKGIIEGNINGENAKWYVENGRATDATGAVSSGGDIWYYENGRVNTEYTGVIDYSGAIWYVENGVVESSYNGIAKTPTGWWYVTDGKVDTRQNKLIETDGNYYYVRHGKVDFSYTGIGRNDSGSFRVAGGDWIPSYTGISLAEDGVIYYVNNGQVDFSFTGFVSTAGNQWYVSNGVVDKTVMDYIEGEIDGEYRSWPVIHGRVVEDAAYTMAVKANDYSSETEWMMMIDSSANRVGVFRGEQGNWEFVYYWVCTTGDTSDPETVTVKGEFEITDNRGYSFSDYDYTCYYYSGFYGAYLFHSTLYQRGTFDDLNSSLGGNASHGCVRLALANAKWVFYNIPVGTKVLSY